MIDEYKITLYPMIDGKRVIVNGKDFTTSAQNHNVTVGGRKYYIRENPNGAHSDLEERVRKNLTNLVAGMKHGGAITISISRETED